MFVRLAIALALLLGLVGLGHHADAQKKVVIFTRPFGSGSVTFDTSSAIANSVTNTFNYSSGVTVSASATLVVAYTWTQNQTAFTTVVWDQGGTNQSMTQIGTTVVANSGIGSLAIWCKTSPATGTNLTLQVNAPGGGERIFAAISSWKGTNATVTNACKNFASNKTVGGGNTDTTISTAVTSATGHAVTGGGLSDIANDTISMNGTQLSSQSAQVPVANNRQSGAASVTETFNGTTAGNLAVVGIDVSP